MAPAVLAGMLSGACCGGVAARDDQVVAALIWLSFRSQSLGVVATDVEDDEPTPPLALLPAPCFSSASE
jgi:hypothetical protein